MKVGPGVCVSVGTVGMMGSEVPVLVGMAVSVSDIKVGAFSLGPETTQDAIKTVSMMMQKKMIFFMERI